MLNQAKQAIAQIVYPVLKKFEPSKNTWSLKKREKAVLDGYSYCMNGRSFDIQNPLLFTEKLQWYKLYYKHSDMVNIVDKYLFKEYINRQLGAGYTIPMYGAWTSLEEFEKAWPSLPEEFCLKSTLQSDGKYIKIIHKKSEVDFAALKQELKEWLVKKNTLINSFCSAYYDAVPRILAEEYMAQIDDQLYDYKLFCFQGKPYYVYVATDHFGKDTHGYPITFYDLNWNRLDVRYGDHKQGDVPKPKHFDEMVKIAEKLSKDFPFIRVDFFDLEDKLYMAELTFYPGGGYVPYYPMEFDKQMGDLFILPEKNVK